MFARLTRSVMLEVLSQDYVRTARAKGLKERIVIGKHALKNALIPLVTVAGMQFGFLIGRHGDHRDGFRLAGRGPPGGTGHFQPRLPAGASGGAGSGRDLRDGQPVVDLIYLHLDPQISYLEQA